MNKLLTVYDDKEPLNNVINEISLDVDEVFYVYHHEVPRTSFNNISRVIKNHKDIDLRFIKLENDEKQLNELIDENTIVDVGGAKYLSLVLFDMCGRLNNKVIYYDSEENLIKDYRTHKALDIDVVKLNIEDALRLRGGEIVSQLHHNVTEKENKETIIDLVESNLDDYSSFIKYITQVSNKMSDSNYLGNYEYAINRKDCIELIEGNDFNNIDELFTITDDRISFVNRKLRDIVMVSGTFLENYLYIKLNELHYFDDIKMSVIIDFSDEKYSHPVRCEIDCLVIKDNQLLFCSCKSSKATTDDLNEIYVHNKMFGNSRSKAVMFVGEELDRRYPSIYAKGIELGIYVVDKSSILRKGAAAEFKDICEGTYRYDEIF
ncbi:MAG: DUF1887 family protein [Erysipelotrichaceae bacterium]|nr:DUF1887 family protein [Erysipelotrichaceae bacterium]